MSQSQSPAAAPSAFAQIRFEEVAEAMPALMTSLFETTDKQAARAWAVRYGEMMVRPLLLLGLCCNSSSFCSANSLLWRGLLASF